MRRHAWLHMKAQVEYVVLRQQFCDQTGQTSWRLFRIIQGCSLDRLVLDRNKREIRSYSNSGYGDGISISFDNIDAMWLKASSEERLVAGVASSNEEEDDDFNERQPTHLFSCNCPWI